MPKVFISPVIRSAVFRNAGHLLKLGGLAAVAMFAGNVFRTAGQSFIRTVYDDFQTIRDVIQDARP